MRSAVGCGRGRGRGHPTEIDDDDGAPGSGGVERELPETPTNIKLGHSL